MAGSRPEILRYDLARSLTLIREAAVLAGVTPQAVRRWITVGYLTSDGTRTHLAVTELHGVRYVIPLDVLRAEAATRGKGRPRSGGPA